MKFISVQLFTRLIFLPDSAMTQEIPPLRPIRSLLFTLLIQATALIITLSIEREILSVFFQISVAAIFSRLSRLSTPWLLCNLILPIATHVEISSWIPLSGLVVALLIFSPTLREPIPFYPTRPKVYQELADIVAQKKVRRFVDLGSGFGSVLFALAPTFPETIFIGYEIGIFPVTLARVRSWWYPNVRFIRKSLWDVNLGSFDCIYAFLSPPPMAALEEKLLKEMNPSATFITNSFPLPNSQTNYSVTIGGQSLLTYGQCDIGTS
jgi:hypothetical protein